MLRFNLRTRSVDDARAAIGMRGQLNDLEIESPADGGCAIAVGGPDRCCSTSLKLVMGNAGAAEIAISRSGRDAHAARGCVAQGVREHYDDRADDSRDAGLKGQPIRWSLADRRRLVQLPAFRQPAVRHSIQEKEHASQPLRRRGFVRIVACMTVAGAGFGGGSDSGVGPDGKVHQGVGVSGAMTVSPTSVTIVQGRTATVTLTLTLKWRSERRDLPMKAVAIAGEWSDMATMEKCYDLPD